MVTWEPSYEAYRVQLTGTSSQMLGLTTPVPQAPEGARAAVPGSADELS